MQVKEFSFTYMGYANTIKVFEQEGGKSELCPKNIDLTSVPSGEQTWRWRGDIKDWPNDPGNKQCKTRGILGEAMKERKKI